MSFIVVYPHHHSHATLQQKLIEKACKPGDVLACTILHGKSSHPNSVMLMDRVPNCMITSPPSVPSGMERSEYPT